MGCSDRPIQKGTEKERPTEERWRGEEKKIPAEEMCQVCEEDLEKEMKLGIRVRLNELGKWVRPNGQLVGWWDLEIWWVDLDKMGMRCHGPKRVRELGQKSDVEGKWAGQNKGKYFHET